VEREVYIALLSSNSGSFTYPTALMQRALRINDDSQQLWLEYCKLELIFREKIRARQSIIKNSENNIHEGESSDSDSEEDNKGIIVPKMTEEVNDNTFEVCFLPGSGGSLH
jgi:U3 small nucleolar RNA-associated protein 6